MIALVYIAECRSGNIHRPLVVFLQPHDLAGLMQRKRIEEDGVRDAEYRRVRPNSNGHGDHRHGREAGRFPQHAKLVAQVPEQCFHSVHSYLIAAMN